MTPEESTEAERWWRSLSMNEQKAYAKEVLGLLWEYAWGSRRYTWEIWKAKGQP